MITLLSRKRASSLALAIALATGSAVVATAVIPAEANAQRNRDRDRDRGQESDGGGYSDAFREAYVPLDEALKAEGTDIAPMRAQYAALAGLLNSNDEKIAGGSLIFNAGARLQDKDLQLLGMETMVASGKIPTEQVGRYNFIAYQLSNEKGDLPKARRYLQAAIDNNFSTETIAAADLQIAMAESYFGANEFQAGFDYLKGAIAERKAQGLPVEEQWYRRGVTVSYEYEVVPTVYEFLTLWLSDYPATGNWRDAINVTRNLNTFQPAEILDLFRLARRVGSLQDASDYDYYVESADPRRLPKEVTDVINEGTAAGVLNSNNLFIAEAREIAAGRIESDRRDLPELERDAMAPDAGLRTVAAAGSAFLSYDEFGKAVTFYERALTMPGVERNEALTRLGIAQLGLRDFDAARNSFEQVTGNRQPIARLWIAYANQLEGAATPTAAPVAAEPAADPAA